MPHDKQDPTPNHSKFMERVRAVQQAEVGARIEDGFQRMEDAFMGNAPKKQALDPNAVAAIRIAEAIQKIVALEDPVPVLLALGLHVGATVARQSPPDFSQGMATVHTVALSEVRRRRPGLRV